MKVVAGGVLLLAVVHLSHPCIKEGTITICFNIPPYFEPGSSSLLMVLKDVGEINSTVLQSENLTSITRLTINNAGVTRIAEKAFSSFTNLKYLSLELNNLSQINSNWFKEPAALSEIILTGNHIEVLSESTLGQFANLTSLWLNKNMLRNIEQNSFSFQAALAELDLSKNKLTWVSPQAFRSLTSTKIRLGGNPWDCSCEAEDFVDFVKALQSRSQLENEMDVTCESPPSLRGQLVWNVSICATSPSITSSVGPSSTVKVVTTSPSPTSETETSVKPKPTISSSHTVPSLETSVHPKPTYAHTPGPASTVKVETPSSRPTSNSVKVVTTTPSRPTSDTSFIASSTDVPAISSSHTVKVVTTPPPRPTSNSDISFKPTSTDTSTIGSSHTVTDSSLKTSVHPKPTYAYTSGPASTVKVETPSSRPTSNSHKPTDIPTTSSYTIKVVTTPLSRPTSNSGTSFIASSTDASTISSSQTVTVSSLETSVHPKPTYVHTPGPASTVKVETPPRPTPKTETKPTSSSHTGSSETSPLVRTETSAHAELTNSSTTASEPAGVTVPSQPPSDTNIVRALIAVIVVLCVLLFVVYFLAVRRRRKHNKKSVTPGHPREDKKQLEEESRSSHDSLRSSENKDAEMARITSFTGIRAKSANAVILMSPFCASGKNPVTLHIETEAQAKVTENSAEGKQKLVNETEATGAAGGFQTENPTNTTEAIKENEKPANPGTNLDKNPECVPVSTDMVPYLSIGTDQNKSLPAEESAEGPGLRSKGSKIIKRISTWPPAAAQWQERCKRKAEDEEDGDDVTVWRQNVTKKFSDEIKKTVNDRGHPFSFDGDKEKGETMKNQMGALMNLRQSLKPIEEEHLKKEGMAMGDTTTVTQTTAENRNANQENLHQNRHQTSGKSSAHNIKSSKEDDQRKESKRAVHSRQRAENRASSSKAPSGGTSPDDETLLSGNDYAFMNLLHEVVQNNGRWTRQRWKQTHANKQRR
ncbi:mucin-5AC isoform X1 [Oreochromis niloticus]|uniref:mucin-5AC isoform X1 n=1 Tax=Oreochromis niloticus TaxID=8128 RepID=UPI0006747CB3|nr:mucin-5AC isoform X1 [Oreochromis niloticus]